LTYENHTERELKICSFAYKYSNLNHCFEKRERERERENFREREKEVMRNRKRREQRSD
jgi:hypothetical protein